MLDYIARLGCVAIALLSYSSNCHAQSAEEAVLFLFFGVESGAQSLNTEWKQNQDGSFSGAGNRRLFGGDDPVSLSAKRKATDDTCAYSVSLVSKQAEGVMTLEWSIDLRGLRAEQISINKETRDFLLSGDIQESAICRAMRIQLTDGRIVEDNRSCVKKGGSFEMLLLENQSITGIRLGGPTRLDRYDPDAMLVRKRSALEYLRRDYCKAKAF